jgi:hypothetical protein
LVSTLPVFSQTDSAAPAADSVSDTSAQVEAAPAAVEDGSIGLLIARPISQYGRRELTDTWLLRLCESYFYFRLSGVPALNLVDSDTLEQMLSDYQAYRGGIQKPRYRRAAEKLSVPYVLVLQIERGALSRGGQISIGKDTGFFGELYSVKGDTTVMAESVSFPLRQLGGRLDNFILRLLESMGIPEDKQNTTFLRTAVTGRKGRDLKKLGEILDKAEPYYDEKTAAKIEEEFNELLSDNNRLTFGYYAAGKLFANASHPERAAGFLYAVANRLGTTYPPAFVIGAEQYRRAERCERALSLIQRVEGIESVADEAAQIRRQCRK